MADADKTLKLLIQMGVVGRQDVVAANQLIRETTQATSDSVPALEKQAGAVRHVSHGISKARLQGELFRRTMLSLGEYTPGMEYAVMGGATAFGALTAAVIGSGIALKWTIDKFEAMDKALAEGAQAIPEITHAMEEKDRATLSAANSAQALADAEANILSQGISLQDQLKDELSLYQQIERARAALDSAQKENAIANIQNMESSGKYNPEQAAEARVRVEKFYLEKGQKDKEAAENYTLNANQVSLQAANDKQQPLKDRADSTAATADAEKAQFAELPDNKDVMKTLRELQGKLTVDQLHLQDLLYDKDPVAGIRKLFDAFSFSGHDWRSHSISSLQDKIGPEERSQADLEMELKQIKAANTPAASDKRKHDQDIADRAASDSKANAKDIDDQKAEIKKLKIAMAATRPLERETVSTKEATLDLTDETRVRGQVTKDVTAIQQAAALSGSSVTTAAAVRAIQDLKTAFTSHHDVVVAELRDLGTSILQLQSQIQHTAGRSFSQ